MNTLTWKHAWLSCYLALFALTASLIADPGSNQYTIGPITVQGIGPDIASAKSNAEQLMWDEVDDILDNLPPGHFFSGIQIHAVQYDPLSGTYTISFSVIIGVPGPPGQ